MHKHIIELKAALVLLLALAGCRPEFDPFNLVDKPRVLAISAEPPALAPGATAVLQPLVSLPAGSKAKFRWSWCPLSLGSTKGYECAVDQKTIEEMAAKLAPGTPLPPIDFDLGKGEEARFSYLIPPQFLSSLCGALLSEDIPSFVPVPDCGEKLSITIRLEMTSGSEKMIAVKELPLYLEASDATNENPTLGAVRYVREGQDPQDAVELAADKTPALAYGQSYRLSVEVPAASAQTFTPKPAPGQGALPSRRERIWMTWYVTSGSTEFKRTTFIDGEIGLDELGDNVWQAPDKSEAPEGRAVLYFVLQDERGGLTWAERSVGLEER